MTGDTEFQNSTVLVTGASRGIGAETALAFGTQGAFTLIHYHQGRSEAEAVLDRIRSAGGQGAVLQSNLGTSEGIGRLIERIDKIGRPIEILVNNAGSLIQRTRFLDLTEELWNEVFTLNLSSAFRITQALLPSMLDRGKGYIVNISSVAARNGGGLGAIPYSSSKAALSTMTKGLAKEFGPAGIRINAVSPGTIDTNYHKTFSTAEMLDKVVSGTPLARLGRADEIASVIVFLCSKAAGFVQGQVIEVNGGFLMI